MILSIIHCSPDKIVGEDQLFKKLHDQIDKRVSRLGHGGEGEPYNTEKEGRRCTTILAVCFIEYFVHCSS